MNKAELIEALAARLGDRKQAVAALDAVLTEIQSVVTRGDKVAITGFGVFEKRVRAARTARNPRTGEPVKVKKTSVPAFRAGATFREMVAADGKAAKKAVVKSVSRATATKAAGEGRAATRSATKTAASAAKVGKAAAKAAPSKAEAPKAAAKAPAKSAARASKTTARGAAKSTTKATAGKR